MPTPWQPDTYALDAVLDWSRTLGLEWHPKRPSPLMQVTAAALHTAGILGRSRFLDDYTTVLRHRAYTPWVGQPCAAPEQCWARIQTVVHEVQHWLQWQREPGLRFAVRYVTSDMARAVWEAEAYGCNIELAAWRGDPLPRAATIADRLREYGCGDAARSEAERLLGETVERAANGRFQTDAVNLALPLLEGLRSRA